MGGHVHTGEVVMTRGADGRVEITQAPDTALMSLQMLANLDPATSVVTGRTITLAGQVTYRVTGWDTVQACLVLTKERSA
ncbi:hypothetical protein L3Q67_00995 [Saccharothrix sp. AJ9571]|nr:hypothetical protein L3Q67_00995 [Saccharothrix sp. AJ9571]